ncbi:tRNA wybutosine-synthesizing protein 2 -like protein [Trichinella pseudospiralis]|uniref:tRNA(Phe) (4-demethylwyosine(37)-C(7)) aminocarboxypropyltransferase n=1 Tax=Trichinella pseudospiralis TaxID=6337 RepID=A0A0V1EY11_TRIPS|nr:tRNA wybutosine-synthesizing protein 2 -like protein [Trichinella pseudospiralis]
MNQILNINAMSNPTPHELLQETVIKFCNEKGIWHPDLLNEIPKHWEKRDDMVLFPANAFKAEAFNLLEKEFWIAIAKCLNASRVARIGRIHSNDFRSPRVTLILGEHSRVLETENHIKYGYDVVKCMFSKGNVSERMRMASLNCAGEIVADLFAGIGYFTLPLLVHAKAAFVHACEWNPNALDDLNENLKINSVSDRCKIYFGDCREKCPNLLANRVILGILPSSMNYWYTACKALKPCGGILHIHGNVTRCANRLERKCPCQSAGRDLNECITFHRCLQESSILLDCFTKFAYDTAATIEKILFTIHQMFYMVIVIGITKVKWYGPRIAHLVVDLQCKPKDYTVTMKGQMDSTTERHLSAGQNLLEILDSNLQTLQNIWNEMGLPEYERKERLQNTVKQINNLLSDMIAEEEGFMDLATRRIEYFKTEVNALEKELSLQEENEGDFLGLVVEEHYYRQRLKQLREEEKRRKALYSDLIENLQILYTRLGEDFSSISSNFDLSTEHLDALSAQLKRKRELCKSRSAMLKVNMAEIKSMVEEMHYTTKSSFKNSLIMAEDITQNCSLQFLKSVQSFHDELKHEYAKFIEQRKLICEEKIAQLNQMWNCCKIASERRQLFITSIKDKYSAKALMQYDNEINNLEKFYESRKPVLQLYEEWENLWQMKINFEKRGLDAVRFFNRGGALLQEEKERKLIEHKLPKIKSKLEQAVYLWNDQHPGELLPYDGICFLTKINNIETEYAQQKEKEKVEKKKARNRCLEEEAKCVSKIVRTSSLRQKSPNCRPLIPKMCASLTKSKSTVVQITKQSPNISNNNQRKASTSLLDVPLLRKDEEKKQHNSSNYVYFNCSSSDSNYYERKF